MLLSLVFLLPGPWLAAQADAPPEVSATQADQHDDPWAGQPAFSANEVELTVFTPENLIVDDLYHTAQQIHGRTIWIKESGLRQQPPSNMQMLGDSILIFDTPEYSQRVLEALIRLDAEASTGESTSRRVLRESELELFEYRPRFLSLHAVADSLEPFNRQNVVYREVDDERFEVIALTPAWSRGMMIVRDTSESVAQIKAFLERIDVPAPHVTVSCLVLKATRSDGGNRDLPAELVEHLSQLVPYDQFELLTMGLVQSAVSPDMEMMINMPLPSDGLECSLSMQVEAFDEIESALTLQEARFSVGLSLKFATRVTLHQDEYVVLGASGREPVFVVMRMKSTGTRPASVR
jgi:hypothetical protein